MLWCREYIQDTLPAFAEQNPHIDVFTLKKRNKFPLVKAEYGRHQQQRFCMCSHVCLELVPSMEQHSIEPSRLLARHAHSMVTAPAHRPTGHGDCTTNVQRGQCCGLVFAALNLLWHSNQLRCQTAHPMVCRAGLPSSASTHVRGPLAWAAYSCTPLGGVDACACFCFCVLRACSLAAQ